MKPLIKLAEGIDWLSHKLYLIAAWAALAAALISAGNAVIRWIFNSSSNGRLEVQWYMFALCVMLAAGFVLKVNEHVRVDVIYGKLKGNRPVWIDIFGIIFFLLPVCYLMVYYSLPLAIRSFVTQEMSSNAGGLVRWPFHWMLPVGFTMLGIQGISELIKRIAYVRGEYAMDTHYEKPLQ
jgi:TRAP-type mannitol/chloroaromatic compound transport system permease small subunit